MLDESLRRRLEALNRERLPAAAPRGVSSERISRPTGAALRTGQGGQVAQATGDLLASAVVCENQGGEHLLVPLAVDSLWPAGERLIAGRLEHLQSLPADNLADGMAEFVAAMPDRTLLLDLETCGLGGSALFLIGLLRKVDDRLTIELLLAKHYGQERAVLQALWQRVAECDVLVTYNGKSFDWPTVLDRTHRHLLHKEDAVRKLIKQPPAHVDALHVARRRWKTTLPDCKLQTIERLICRRTRVGDIPGNQIPAAYDAFVRTGQPSEMEAILHHNAIDLVTLLDIAMRVAA